MCASHTTWGLGQTVRACPGLEALPTCLLDSVYCQPIMAACHALCNALQCSPKSALHYQARKKARKNFHSCPALELHKVSHEALALQVALPLHLHLERQAGLRLLEGQEALGGPVHVGECLLAGVPVEGWASRRWGSTCQPASLADVCAFQSPPPSFNPRLWQDRTSILGY